MNCDSFRPSASLCTFPASRSLTSPEPERFPSLISPDRPGAPSIAHLRWVGRKSFAGHQQLPCFAIVLALAVVSSCRHSERSEESRGSRPAIAVRSFPPRISTVVAASPTPTKPRHFDRKYSRSHREHRSEKSASLPQPLPGLRPLPLFLSSLLDLARNAEPISLGLNN
jgi:hypothetical protein